MPRPLFCPSLPSSWPPSASTSAAARGQLPWSATSPACSPGTLGKTGNCQVTVNCHYAEQTIAWPVATRLYLPKDWAHDTDRRQKAKVPDEVIFQTKPQIALELLDRAQDWGVRCACVVADADYGD